MNILPYQAEIAKRMLINTENESIDSDAQFVHTTNGYWIAWQSNGMAALLSPDATEDEPCFWVEGSENLAELVALVENGEFDMIEDFDGDDEAWQQACACGCSHQHSH